MWTIERIAGWYVLTQKRTKKNLLLSWEEARELSITLLRDTSLNGEGEAKK